MVAGLALVARDSRRLEIREREVWQPTRMDLVRSQTHGGADGSLYENSTRGSVLTTISSIIWAIVWFTRPPPTVVVWVVGTGGDFPNSE